MIPGAQRMLFPIDSPEADPDKIAFMMAESGEQVSFGQLDKRANQVARVLHDCGVKPGEHVALLMKNNRRFLEACFGMDRAGVYYTTISTRLTSVEIAHIVTDCGAKVLLISSEVACVDAQFLAQLPAQLQCFGIDLLSSDLPSWTQQVDQASDLPQDDPLQGLDMLYSSGTTGRPKGVKWPMPRQGAGQRTMLVDLLQPLFGYDQDCRYLSPAPLYHAAPLRHSMTVIKLGGMVMVMESFDAQCALELIQTHFLTHSQWVPTMFVRLLKLPIELREQFDVSSMKVAVHAASPCPIEVKLQMMNWWGPILEEYYAGTENNGFCSITSQQWLQHQGSVGRATQGQLHICDDDGIELPIGESGLVYFSDGPAFVYHNDAERTAHTRNAQGWTTLGDIGRTDKEGYLYLLDRRDFMIISGGVNIYPQEVENILIAHPKVLDVAVVGVPSDDFGEEVKAVVQLVNSQDAGPELAQELIGYCRSRLASFKCPRSVDFDSQLPRHPTGKLYKKQVRDRYWPNTTI
ncbi:AMP-binding protein [Polaromonas sp. CG_23.6]|uniref:AMP-binding protein n=1 Tax=Polaromonas sp. CG_23.6 TaxID=2760709 RepID=UPI002476DE75|nr:AMP-binding protein [Polaromonas sp. CG_23.6]MDH6186885.1 fatty-acyl-CoA synthase [Polaromonas sp. CG_23.6]